MHKTAMRLMLGLAIGCVLVLSARAADDKKDVTLKGKIVCTKCELGETTDCGQAIKTKIDGKDVTVYFQDKGKAEKYHGAICTAPKDGSVTGVVTVKDKKTWITPAKDGVKYDKSDK